MVANTGNQIQTGLNYNGKYKIALLFGEPVAAAIRVPAEHLCGSFSSAPLHDVFSLASLRVAK